MPATAQTLIPEPDDTVPKVPARRKGPVLLVRCGNRGRADRMLLTGTGHLCNACDLEGDLEQTARRSFWADLITALALAAAGPSALIAAIVLAGLLTPSIQSPAGALLLLYGAAGLAVMQGVFGLWTAVTGGTRELPLTPTHRTVLRAAGVASGLVAMVVGGGLLAVNLAMVLGG